MLFRSISEHQPVLALLAFVGGMSAATGMVIVETIALSTMVCNDLVMPILLRLRWLRLTERGDLTRLPKNFLRRKSKELLPPGERLMARINTQRKQLLIVTPCANL